MNDKPRGTVGWPPDIGPFHPLSSAVMLDIAALSVRGKRHRDNTDHYMALRFDRGQETLMSSLAAADLPAPFKEYGYALVVADSAGGLGANDTSRLVLSALAYQTIRYGEWNLRLDPQKSEDVMEKMAFFSRRATDTMREANRGSRQPGLDASLVGVFVAGDDLFFGRIGHSTAFLFRASEMIQLTTGPRVRDASRNRARLATERMGTPGDPIVDVEHVKLCVEDRLLLCTDGLTDSVSEEDIADALFSRHPPRKDCQRLIDLALEGGSTDDVTAMLADYKLCPAPAPGHH